MPRSYLIIFLLLATIAVGYFSLLPEWNLFQGLRAETDRFETVSLEFDKLIEIYNRLLNSMSTVNADDLERINQALPQGTPKKRFMVQLEHFTQKSDLSLKGFSFGSDSEIIQSAGTQAPSGQPVPGGARIIPLVTGATKQLSANLDISGDYDILKRFLIVLQKNIPLIETDTLSFSAVEKGNPYTFKLDLKTYYQ